MSNEEQLLYIELSDLLGCDICAFCENYLVVICAIGKCIHPCSYTFKGEDCCGFKPKLPLCDIVDIVGICLKNDWHTFKWWNDNGVLKITGRVW